jgi:hypothetical protein
MPRPLLASLVLAAIAVVAPPALAQLTTLETENARVVYNDLTHSWLAPYAARCFENAFRVQRRLWNYAPSEKVTIILDDASDYGNAGVWVAPRNSMVVQIAPSNSVYETGPSNERINFTMNHEGVHVVALDGATGADRFFRGLFAGKVRESARYPESILFSHLTVPRRSAPRWYHEGIAVFLETWMAGGLGRAQGPYDEMVFRAMVRDSARIYDPLGLEAEGTRVDFQVGVNSYLYGTRFMSWLALEHGPESLLRWVGRDPGSSATYTGQFRNVYGRSLDDAWAEWIAWERAFQMENLAAVRRYPTTAYRDLAPRAFGSVSRPAWDAATRTLYFAAQYPGRVAHIGALHVDSGEYRVLREVKGPALYFVTSLAFDPESRTLFYTTDNNEWRDLWALDPATGNSWRLEKDLRVGDLVVNRADRSLWGVRHLNGLSTIIRMPPPYRDWQRIVTLPFGQDLYDLDISPDGRWLAGSFAEISGRQTLRLYDLATFTAGDTTSRTLFDFGNAIPTSFVFSPNGGSLAGSSYYTGVSNIFRYNLAADSMEVLSNAETGFFRPLPVAEDSLIVFRYSGEGFVPALIDPIPLSDVGAITFLGERIAAKHPVVRTWRAPSPRTVDIDSLTVSRGPYRGLSRLGLATVHPIVQGYKNFAATGVRAEVSDPLQLHRFGLTASFTPDGDLPENERLHLGVDYERGPWRAAFVLNGADFYDLVGPTKVGRKGRAATLRYTRDVFVDRPRTVTLTGSAAYASGLDRHPLYQNVATSPEFERLIGARLQLDESNLRSSIGAVDHELGYRWSAGVDLNSVRLESPEGSEWRTTPLLAVTLDAGRPVLVPNSSLWLRVAGGYSPGDVDDPFANFFFGGFGNNWVDHQEPKRYRDAGSFPGLDLNAAGGTNYARALVDWNLPPLRFRRAGTTGLYASWLRASLFGAALRTELGRPDLTRTLYDAGAQVDLRLTALSRHNLTLSIGYARAFEKLRRPGDEFMASLKIL